MGIGIVISVAIVGPSVAGRCYAGGRGLGLGASAPRGSLPDRVGKATGGALLATTTQQSALERNKQDWRRRPHEYELSRGPPDPICLAPTRHRLCGTPYWRWCSGPATPAGGLGAPLVATRLAQYPLGNPSDRRTTSDAEATGASLRSTVEFD